MFQQINERSNSETTYQVATTVLKAFNLLEYIASHQPIHPPALCKALGLTRANLHRLLFTLSTLGYIEKTAEGYQLSLKLFHLGSRVPLTEQLKEAAKVQMVELQKVAQENISLTTLYQDTVISIEEVQSSHTVVLNPQATTSYPVNACSSGKLLLSTFEENELKRYMHQVQFVQKTEKTIMDKKEFAQHITMAAQNGYALDIHEFDNHLSSVAAPIVNRQQKVIAAIVISGPSMRLSEKRLNELIPPLKQAADTISRRMGYTKE